MTTTISNIYDAIHSSIASLFPSKSELSDPINIENNDELSLSDGYGIYFGPANNSFRIVGCKYSLQRTITVTLTKVVYAGHKNITLFESKEKDLLEDQHTLINDFSKNENIGSVVIARDYISDNGIERILGDTKNFVMIQSTFKIEYFETLA